MKQVPDALDAQKRLDQLIAEWREELAKMENELVEKKDEFEQRKLIMSEQKRLDATREIDKLVSDLKNYLIIL